MRRNLGTDVFVLTIYEPELGRSSQRTHVSPILQKCMGESPGVRFVTDSRGKVVVSVAGYELQNDKWVQESNPRGRQ
jgi:hypothetical protein